MAAQLIIIAGGIGTGKSVVSRMLRCMGKEVYDCDSRARLLMESDPQLQAKLAEAFGDDIYRNGRLDRQRLAAIVFNNRQALNSLNALVHPTVKHDITAWAHDRQGTAWIESAIARESSLDSLAAEAWLVTAPLDVRIKRVMDRDQASAAQVESRIRAQECALPWRCPVVELANDGATPLLPRLHELLSRRLKGNSKS